MVMPLLKFGKFHLRIFKNLIEQPRPDGFTGVNGNHGATSIGMLQKMVTAFDPQNIESCPAQRHQHFTSTKSGQAWHKSNRDPLDPDKFSFCLRLAFYFQAKGNGFLHAFHQLVKRPRLGVAAPQFRDACNIVTIFVAFHDHTELTLARLFHI
jgi:hypothetical protein